jgi:hypothetical protein
MRERTMKIMRFQVVEVKTGYAVMDTRNNKIWTKTYTKLGWAIRRAIGLNEAFGKHKSD